MESIENNILNKTFKKEKEDEIKKGIHNQLEPTIVEKENNYETPIDYKESPKYNILSDEQKKFYDVIVEKNIEENNGIIFEGSHDMPLSLFKTLTDAGVEESKVIKKVTTKLQELRDNWDKKKLTEYGATGFKEAA